MFPNIPEKTSHSLQVHLSYRGIKRAMDFKSRWGQLEFDVSNRGRILFLPSMSIDSCMLNWRPSWAQGERDLYKIVQYHIMSTLDLNILFIYFLFACVLLRYFYSNYYYYWLSIVPRDRTKKMNTATQDSSNTKQNKDPQGRARAPFDLATSCVSVFLSSIGIAFLKDPNISII